MTNFKKPSSPISLFSQEIKKLLFGLITFITILTCFIGCKKESPVTSIVQEKSPLQIVAMRVLKSNASAQEFNDMDWNNVQTSYLNNKPFLLRIKSRTDSTKVLLYSKANGIIHIRWAQFKLNTSPSSGVVVVSSLNEINRKESSFKNGMIYATRITRNNGQPINLNSNANNAGSNSISASIKYKFHPNVMVEAPPDSVDTGDGGDGGGGDDGGDGGDDGGTGNTGTGSSASGSNGGDPVAYSIVLQEVTITGTPITNGAMDMYSLYVLLDYNPAYLYSYTNNLTSPTKGTIVTILPNGGTTGTDPNFQKGKTPATGAAIFTPAGSLLGGWMVTISYTLSVINGVTTVTITSIGASTVGAESAVTTYQTTSSSSSVIGSVIYFSFGGNDVYGIYGAGYHDPKSIQGTYNTATGVFSIYVSSISSSPQ